MDELLEERTQHCEKLGDDDGGFFEMVGTSKQQCMTGNKGAEEIHEQHQ